MRYSNKTRQELQYAKVLTVLLMVTSLSNAALADSKDVVVEDAWSRASISVNRPSAAFMTVRNTGEDPVTLTSLETPLAMKSTIHETQIDANGVISMRLSGEILIAPGNSVTLKPGGLHVMLMNLQKPMKQGDAFSLTLNFRDGGQVTVDVPILSIGARGPES